MLLSLIYLNLTTTGIFRLVIVVFMKIIFRNTAHHYNQLLFVVLTLEEIMKRSHTKKMINIVFWCAKLSKYFVYMWIFWMLKIKCPSVSIQLNCFVVNLNSWKCSIGASIFLVLSKVPSISDAVENSQFFYPLTLLQVENHPNWGYPSSLW